MEYRVKPLTVLKMKRELCNKYGKFWKYKGYKAGKEKEEVKCKVLAMVGKFKDRCKRYGK